MQLAMPLFTDIAPVSRAAVLAAWDTLFPNGPHLIVGQGKDSVDEYKVDGQRSVFVVQIPKPVPEEEALSASRGVSTGVDQAHLRSVTKTVSFSATYADVGDDPAIGLPISSDALELNVALRIYELARLEDVLSTRWRDGALDL
jgi:hypothetical protein